MSVVELAKGGARFIEPGRQWGGGEVAGGGGVLIPVGFEGVKGEEETGQCRLDGELEWGNPMLRFDFTRLREGGTRRRMERWRTGRGNGGSGIRRWEKTLGWADLGQRPERLDCKGILIGKIKLGCQGFRAELILGCAEK
jgi:hypothetical protein